jgi:hypothetical protein
MMMDTHPVSETLHVLNVWQKMDNVQIFRYISSIPIGIEQEITLAFGVGIPQFTSFSSDLSVLWFFLLKSMKLL